MDDNDIKNPGEEGGEDEQEQLQKQEVAEVVEVFNMADDEFYPEDHKEKQFKDSSLSKRTFQFFGVYG